jgi:hypothetical protein
MEGVAKVYLTRAEKFPNDAILGGRISVDVL